jgi:hypothetical protein
MTTAPRCTGRCDAQDLCPQSMAGNSPDFALFRDWDIFQCGASGRERYETP